MSTKVQYAVRHAWGVEESETVQRPDNAPVSGFLHARPCSHTTGDETPSQVTDNQGRVSDRHHARD